MMPAWRPHIGMIVRQIGKAGVCQLPAAIAPSDGSQPGGLAMTSRSETQLDGIALRSARFVGESRPRRQCRKFSSYLLFQRCS